MGSQALTVDTDVALAMGVDVEETAATVDETGAFLTADRSSMSVAEQYEFDRMGYLVLRDFTSPEETAALRAATDRLEAHCAMQFDPDGTPAPPHKLAPWGGQYHFDPELGYHANQAGGSMDGSGDNGPSTIIEDYFNADPAFDLLIDHPKTMAYINTIIQERPTINNSEIRLRYPNNYSGSHQPGGQPSGPPKGKYQYQVSDGEVDCKMVRMIYFVDDVTNDGGAFCVAPASHKSNFPPPPEYASGVPETDPTMVGLEVKAGDAVLFTEALRHGGFTIANGVPRKTLHVGYGPYWLMSQNIATMDEPPFITEETYDRYRDAQRLLFNAWPRDARAGASFSQTAVLGKL